MYNLLVCVYTVETSLVLMQSRNYSLFLKSLLHQQLQIHATCFHHRYHLSILKVPITFYCTSVQFSKNPFVLSKFVIAFFSDWYANTLFNSDRSSVGFKTKSNPHGFLIEAYGQ